MDDRELSVLLNEYERAQEVAQHSDAVFWEITSIIWGANTLMLGFVLEAIGNASAEWLIVATATLGVVLSMLVVATYYSSKVGQRIAFKVCRSIEARLPTNLKLHTQIDQAYPKQFIQRMVWLVTIIFLLAWIIVGRSALGIKGALLVVAAVVLVSMLLLIFWVLGLREQ
jgi:hypothetical protein